MHMEEQTFDRCNKVSILSCPVPFQEVYYGCRLDYMGHLCQKNLEFCGVFRSPLVCPRVLWNVLELGGIFLYIVESSRVFQNMLEYKGEVGICWMCIEYSRSLRVEDVGAYKKVMPHLQQDTSKLNKHLSPSLGLFECSLLSNLVPSNRCELPSEWDRHKTQSWLRRVE